ncbi:protein kinase [Streptomyces sp. NPDC046984]|uniref:serine/threonine-protein kinase n=1 Tax=Streptomyces sp. NPDC046984 TaxID=3155138 RepID=UPI0033D916FD
MTIVFPLRRVLRGCRGLPGNASGGVPGLLVTGRYRLVESIGQGGMGRVWRAADEILDRQVAVKEIRMDGLDTEDVRTRRERTLREARATARIDHPNVVRIYDVVDEGDRLWIVMELVDGRSLERILVEEGPLGVRETARIGLELVAALRQVHAGGVLHRDIKPGNVLVERRGRRVVLTDFGIAAIQDAKALTMAGMLVGSPDYLAPERISGRPQGPPSDVWSLGATLCAALGGHSPFSRSTTLATLHAVLYEEPQLPASAAGLTGILAALLEKEPTVRPGLEEVAQELERVAGDGTGAWAGGGPGARTGGEERAGDGEGTGPAPGGAQAPEPGGASTTAVAPEAGERATPAYLDPALIRAARRPRGDEESAGSPYEGALPADGVPEEPVVEDSVPVPRTPAAPDRSAAAGPPNGRSATVRSDFPARNTAEPGGPDAEPGEASGNASTGTSAEAGPAVPPTAPTRALPTPTEPSGVPTAGAGPAIRSRPPGAPGDTSSSAGASAGAVAPPSGLADPPSGCSASPHGALTVPLSTAPAGAARSGGRTAPGHPPDTGLPGPARPSAPRRSRRRAVVAAVVGVVVAGGVAGAVIAAEAGPSGRTHGTSAGSDHPSVSSGGRSGAGGTPTVAGTSRPASLPPGARTEAGLYAWVPPPGWQRVAESGAEVHYSSPDRSQEIVANATPARGDLLEQWEQAEQERRKGLGYRRIRLDQGTFRGGPAVVWEYTVTAKGRPWHVRLLGFRAHGTSYEVSTWYHPDVEDRATKVYDEVKEGFTPL